MPERIKQSGQFLVSLINDILGLSKIESGKMTLSNEPTSLEDLVANIVSVIRPSVLKKGQQFDVRLNQIRHEFLMFDVLRINQMLINLLSNAVKFTPEGGSIILDVTESDYDLEDRARFTFKVIDNGVGMSPEFLDHIFETFVREQDSCISKVEGSGLGMAITKMIVDMMGGSITVDSVQGQGSTFTVQLDLHLAESAPGDGPLPPLRALVADGDGTSLRTAQEMLEACGVSADSAQDGASALKKAVSARDAGEDYNLILVDWDLPDNGGVDTAKQLRRALGGKPAIIAVTSLDPVNKYTEAGEAGINGFISKPYFKNSLLRCVRQYCIKSGEPGGDLCQAELRGRKILVAEDNQLNQFIIERLLTEAGMEVDLAESGDICVDLFAASSPGEYDLILMDIHMPVMDGCEASRVIRSMARSDADIPILAITADAFTDDIEMTKQAGMNSHLSKPLDIHRLMAEMRRFLKDRKDPSQ